MADAAGALSARGKVQGFLEAACTGDLESLRKLGSALDEEGKGAAAVAAGVRDANRRTALHFAAREGRTEVCQFLVEQLRLPVDPKDDDGETPLIHAARQGRLETAEYLLDHGADPSVASNMGATALHHAAGIGHIELMKLLLGKGIDVESESDAGTPLVWAAGHGQEEAVKLLLEHNAKPDNETADGITSLLSAVAAGSLPCLEVLIQAGANPNVTAGGATPPHPVSSPPPHPPPPPTHRTSSSLTATAREARACVSGSMDIDPSSASHADGGGDLWPFDSLTTSLFFSSVSSSPPLHPLPVASSSWLTPPSPLWLFDDRQMLPIELGPAPAAAPENTAAVAAAVAEEVHRARSGNTDIPGKTVERHNNKWQFNLSLHDDSTNSSCLFKEKLTHALRYFKDSTDQHLLVQVWAPVKSGDRYVLTTSGQPFVLDHQSIGLLQYRAVSMMYMFSVDGDNAGELGLPGRVYKQKVPEWTPNVQYYSSTEYPRLNHAISYNVHGTVALPVFDPSVQSCIAVVELIMTSKKINYADEVDKVCKALEAVNLKSTEILDHPNVQICNEGRQSALVEILEILTVVCEEHKLPLAQTWVPCKYRSVLAHGGGVKKSCLSFDGSCMGEVCMSTSDVAFHVIDAHMWGFRDACIEHHLQKGQGVSGKAFIYQRPCFSKDISQFCKLEYPLVHYARMFGLAGCFAICLQSPYTGDDYYMLEFFLPPSCRDEDDQNALLESILGLINQCLRNLKVAGNRDSNEASLQLSNVIMIENEDFKTNVHFENSEGCFRESPEDDTHGGAHENDKGNSKISEGHLLTDGKSQNNGVSVSKPNGSGTSDSALLHKNGKPPERRRGKAEKTISLDVLQQYFSGSLKNAAKSLGVCPTTMKRICRQHGISRWPSRKINKVNRSLSKLKQVIESVQGSDAAFNLTSITGPLPTIPVGPSSDSFNIEKASESKAELDRDSSLQKSPENGSHFGVLMSQQGFVDTSNDVQPEADKASLSRSSSGEGSINSRTSEGSCQGSPANGTFVCQPIASTFLEPQPNLQGFTKEPFQEPDLQLCGMLIEDSGSSKDLKNLFSSAINQPMFAPPSNFGPMQNSGTVTIKASFKEDIIRFRFPCSSSVMVLKDEVAKRLRMDAGMFDIKYLDDDHEWVKLACNADLEECMEISRHSGTHVIRLLVSDIAAHIGSSCGSSG